MYAQEDAGLGAFGGLSLYLSLVLGLLKIFLISRTLLVCHDLCR
jgi:hypothetical protein